MLPDDEVELLDRYWRAANYLTVGQIYLLDNPLLRQPLEAEHVKPRLLGHWGTSPGLNLLYAHLNRVIRATDSDMIFLAGPGHGGPAVVANVWMEGTYSEVYPHITNDEDGLRHLFRQFSTPGGIPSHVSAPTPGSIHEGGELGYVLVHAFGAAFDNPDLIVVAVVGDGEAETGPLEASWKGVRFLNPTRDGAVLPILHLNGYKIAGPTVLGRSSDDDVRSLLSGHGYDVRFVEGDEPGAVHQDLAATLDECVGTIRSIQDDTRGARLPGATALAGDRAPHTEGLDRPEGGRREAHRGHLPGAPGPRRQRPTGQRPSADPRGVDALVPSGGAVRRGRAPAWRPRRDDPEGRPAHERQPPRQRRRGPGPAGSAELLGLRRPRRSPRHGTGGVDPATGTDAAGHLRPQPDDVPPVLSRRDQLQPARRRVRGLRPLPGRPDPRHRRPRLARRTA